MLIGVIALVIGSINYNRHRTLLEVASSRATATGQQHVLRPPVFGGIVLLGGFLLVALPRKQFA